MIVSDDIFWLIKSLNKAEKIYFKKFSSFYSPDNKNNYVRLFDFIDKQKVYDEDAVIKHFSNEKFINQLPVAKNYLYNAVLRALKSYRKSSVKRDEVKVMLEDVSVLMDKRLFKQAGKILRRCRKICERYELYSLLLQVLLAESKIVITQRAYNPRTDELIRNNFKERDKIIRIIQNASEYDLLDYEMTSQITQHADSKDKNYISRLNDIISNPVMSDENSAVSLTARLKFNHIYAAYYYAAMQPAESYKYLSKEIKIISEKSELLEDRLNDYFILLYNRLLLSLDLGRYNELEENLLQLRSELGRKEIRENPRLLFYITNSSYLVEMTYLNRSGNFLKTLDVFREYEKDMMQFGYKIIKADQYWLNNTLSQAYFGTGDYKNAVKYLNNILNDTDAELQYSSISFARIFNMVIHYELGNMDLMDYLVKSTYRYFYKKGNLHRFERLIFNFLKKLPDVTTQTELTGKFSELQERIGRLSSESSTKDALRYFDFISWLKSRTENVSFAEAVKAKIPTVY